MPVLLEITLVLILVGTFVSYFTRGRVIAERQAMTDRQGRGLYGDDPPRRDEPGAGRHERQ